MYCVGMSNEYRLTDYPNSNRSSNVKIKKTSIRNFPILSLLFCFIVYCIVNNVPLGFESMIILGTVYYGHCINTHPSSHLIHAVQTAVNL